MGLIIKASALYRLAKKKRHGKLQLEVFLD